MANKIDYIYDDDFDLLIESYDFKQGQANDNQTKVIIKASTGEIRQFVLLGAAIDSYIGSTTDVDIIESRIVSELRKDNIVVIDIDTERTGTSVTSNINVQ